MIKHLKRLLVTVPQNKLISSCLEIKTHKKDNEEVKLEFVLKQRSFLYTHKKENPIVRTIGFQNQ